MREKYRFVILHHVWRWLSRSFQKEPSLLHRRGARTHEVRYLSWRVGVQLYK